MNASDLSAQVTKYFLDRAATYGLDRDALTIEYILNWGGFVNFSYKISDGRQAYHLKLAVSAESINALDGWRKAAPLLRRFNAPPILDAVDVESAWGLLFPSLAGTPPNPNRQVFRIVGEVLRQINCDRELAEMLRRPEAETGHFAYLASFNERFTADLKAIRGTRPPFISEGLLNRLDQEVSDLADRVFRTAAFDEVLTKPVHGDLWLNNILWVSPSEWHILDWDDLGIGDPAADLAALTGPTAHDLRPLKMCNELENILSPAERDRLPLLGRATLLDWVIDPVADWIEAETVEKHRLAVRKEKRRVHEAALAFYEQMYARR